MQVRAFPDLMFDVLEQSAQHEDQIVTSWQVGDVGRYREMQGDVGGCREIQGDTRRYREIQGDTGEI